MMLDLRKTIFATVLFLAIILSALLVLGVRQYQLQGSHRHVIEQTEKLLFQFDAIQGQITESLVQDNYQALPGVIPKIEGLRLSLADILENKNIPNEYKLIFINQVDLQALVSLVNSVSRGPALDKKTTALSLETRKLGNRLALFDRVILNHAKGKVIDFQKTVIGALALLMVFMVYILILWHRQVGLPLIDLIHQLRDVATGKKNRLEKYGKSREVTTICTLFQEILTGKDDLQSREQRLERVLMAVLRVEESIFRAVLESSLDRLHRDICKSLLANEDYCLAWLGVKEPESHDLMPLAADGSTSMTNAECKECMAVLIAAAEEKGAEGNPAARALDSNKPVLQKDILHGVARGPFKGTPLAEGNINCISLPLSMGNKSRGVLTVYSLAPESFDDHEIKMLTRMTDEADKAFSHIERAHRLERDNWMAGLALTASRPMVVSFLADGTIIAINQRIEQEWGYKGLDVAGRRFEEIFLPGTARRKWHEDLDGFLSADLMESFREITILTKNKTNMKLLSHITKVYADPGDAPIIKMTGFNFSQGNTERQPGIISREEITRILGTFPGIIIMTEENGKIFDAAGGYLSRFQMTRDSLVGLDLYEAFHEVPYENSVILQKAVNSGGPMIFKQHFHGLDGDYLIIFLPAPEMLPKARSILMAVKTTDEKVLLYASPQEAILTHIDEQSSSLGAEIKILSQAIEHYTKGMAEKISKENADEIHNDISAKIVQEGERISSIIGHEGQMINNIVSQLLVAARTGENSPES